MKKRLLNLAIFSLILFSIQAQNLPLIGAKWYGSYGTMSEQRYYVAEKDTTIQGKSCVEVNAYFPFKNGSLKLLKQHYFTDSLGFVSFFANDTFYPYFNFNAVKGDSVKSTYELKPITLFVDSVFIEQGLKHFTFKHSDYYSVSPVIERVLKVEFLDDLTEVLLTVMAGAQIGTIIDCYTDSLVSYKDRDNSRCGIYYPSYYDMAKKNAVYHVSQYRDTGSNYTPFYQLKYEQEFLRYYDVNNKRVPNGDIQLKTEAGKTYVYDKNEWVLLYDFTAKVGDTISTRAVINPLHITNNAKNYQSTTTFKYIIDEVFQQEDMLYQKTRSIAGQKWEMPGILREDMGSSIALLGQPINSDTSGINGYIRCFSGGGWHYGYFNDSEVKNCNALYLSLNEKEPLSEVEIYPNPSSNYFTISLNNYEQPISLTILNTLGQVCLQQTITSNHTIVNSNNLLSGLYHIVLQNNNAQLTKKLIIK